MESIKAGAETVVEKAKETAEFLKPKIGAAYEAAKPVAEKVFNEYPTCLSSPPPPSFLLLSPPFSSPSHF